MRDKIIKKLIMTIIYQGGGGGYVKHFEVFFRKFSKIFKNFLNFMALATFLPPFNPLKSHFEQKKATMLKKITTYF